MNQYVLENLLYSHEYRCIPLATPLTAMAKHPPKTFNKHHNHVSKASVGDDQQTTQPPTSAKHQLETTNKQHNHGGKASLTIEKGGKVPVIG